MGGGLTRLGAGEVASPQNNNNLSGGHGAGCYFGRNAAPPPCHTLCHPICRWDVTPPVKAISQLFIWDLKAQATAPPVIILECTEADEREEILVHEKVRLPAPLPVPILAPPDSLQSMGSPHPPLLV